MLATIANRMIAVLVLVFILASTAHAGSVIFVDDDAPPGGDGLSWDTAYRFLQDGLSNAQGNSLALRGGVAEIHVAQGTYKPDRSEANPSGTGDREATFTLTSGVALMGGYAGIGAADPDARNFVLYETILSGDLLGNDGPDFQNNQENSYHVISGFMIAQGTELSGCTVIAGNADGTTPHNRGAGIYLDEGSLLMENCLVQFNWAMTNGAGMYSDGIDLEIVSCEISDNQVMSQAGGVYCINSTATISSCKFERNTTQFHSGGGMFLQASSAEFSDCVFVANATDSDGGYRGGAVIIRDDSAANFSNCSFILNSAGTGGAIQARGDMQITDCLFFFNEAANGNGGAVVCEQTETLSMINCIFLMNQSYIDGGAVFCGNNDVQISNCTFQDNFAFGRGGGINNVGSALDLSNCTFQGNHGSWGGALRNSSSSGSDVVANIQNCIMKENSAGRGGGISAGGGTILVINDCEILDNFASIGGGGIHRSSGDQGSLVICNNCVVTGNESSGQGGGILVSNVPIFLDNCVISDNQADDGGGLFIHETEGFIIDCEINSNQLVDSGIAGGAGASLKNCENLAFINCTFRGNEAIGIFQHGGGGVFMENSEVAFVDCVFNDNWFFSQSGSAKGGGGLFALNSSPLLANCTLYGNRTGQGLDGGGIYLLDSSIVIDNSILWHNEDTQGQSEIAQIFTEGNSPVEINYSTVEGLTGGLGGIGNIGDDPLFIDPDGPDNNQGTEDDDLRLSPGSPCIDAADNTAVPPDEFDLDEDGNTEEPTPFDLDGNPRFANIPGVRDSGNGIAPIVDMGAYEFQLVLALDIKPGGCPNPLNAMSHGMLPVAVLGMEDFDAALIDISSLTIARADGIGDSVSPNEGPPGPHTTLDDVATPFDGELCNCHDLDGDGITDLVIHFSTPQIVEAMQLENLPDGSQIELVISGMLTDTTPFTAIDCIELVPAGDLNGDGAVNATDMIILFSAWGSCRTCIDCSADLDGDCAVNISDLLILLGDWG